MVIVVCCGNKIKDRQLEQSKRVYVITTDSFDDLKVAYSVMSSSTCKIYAFRALLIRVHFLLSHKYVSVKVIVMAQSFPAICKGDAVCTVLNICDVGMSEELTRMPSCSNSSVLHPFLEFPIPESYVPLDVAHGKCGCPWMWPMENVWGPCSSPTNTWTVVHIALKHLQLVRTFPRLWFTSYKIFMVNAISKTFVIFMKIAV